MNDLSQIAQLVKGRNPQEMALMMIKNSNISNPMITQLIDFAQNGDNESFMKLANSFFQQRGLNMDQEFNSFLSMLK